MDRLNNVLRVFPIFLLLLSLASHKGFAQVKKVEKTIPGAWILQDVKQVTGEMHPNFQQYLSRARGHFVTYIEDFGMFRNVLETEERIEEQLVGQWNVPQKDSLIFETEFGNIRYGIITFEDNRLELSNIHEGDLLHYYFTRREE